MWKGTLGRTPHHLPYPYPSFLWSAPPKCCVFWISENSRRLGNRCGCPKFLAGKVFRQISTLLENSSPIFRQHSEMLSLPRFGHFPARKMAAGKSAPPSGALLDFSSETATAFLSFSDDKAGVIKQRQKSARKTANLAPYVSRNNLQGNNKSRRRKRWKTNGEKMVDFWCRFFHGLVPIFSRFTPIFHGL